MASIRVIYPIAFCGILMSTLSCTRKNKDDLSMFHGPCKLYVASNEKYDAIYVDGIKVGYGSVDLKVPCGHRQVRMTRDHHVDFKQYVEVVKGTPAEVKGAPRELGDVEDYALSDELLERLRQGKSPKKEEAPVPVKEAKTEVPAASSPEPSVPMDESKKSDSPSTQEQPKAQEQTDDWS